MIKLDSAFYQKIRFKYKLSVLNENTLEEVWHIRLSRLNVFLVSFSVAVIYFCLIAFLIIKTPLRSFLPGYTENLNLRKQLVLDAVRVDSISEMMRVQSQYIDVLQLVLTGNIKPDTTSTVESLLTQENVKAALEKSKQEAAFCAKYEEDEKYNITTSTDNRSTDINYLMHRPAMGVITEKFDDKNKIFGISIQLTKLSNVYSVLDGVVVFTGFNAEDGLFVMQVQHSDGFISIYKKEQPFLKKTGDSVLAGEILATFTDDKTTPYLVFQLWQRGRPLNPENYITF